MVAGELKLNYIVTGPLDVQRIAQVCHRVSGPPVTSPCPACSTPDPSPFRWAEASIGQDNEGDTGIISSPHSLVPEEPEREAKTAGFGTHTQPR